MKIRLAEIDGAKFARVVDLLALVRDEKTKYRVYGLIFHVLDEFEKIFIRMLQAEIEET